MTLLRQLRWKLFVSHLMIIAVGIAVFLPTAYFLAANPLVQPIDTPLTLGISAAPAAGLQERFQSVMGDALLVAAFAALASAVVVSLFVSKRVVEPLAELTSVSGHLARGYYRERATIQSDDELAVLSQSINQLADTLEATEHRRLGLIADVAHEFRTPLTTIEGYMEGLLDGVIKPEPKIFAMVHHEAIRLKWMVQEMALLSQVEAGELSVQPKPMVLEPLINQVAQQFTPQINDKGLHLVVNIMGRLPMVLADQDRVEQILINLTANAVQYTPTNGVVTIYARPEDHLVEIGISDTGVGLAPEHLPHIFERFYRVDKSRVRQSGGAGIGLTIARHLVFAQGGEIAATSEGVDKGTTVRFTLPVAKVNP